MEKKNIRILSKVDTKSNWEKNNPKLEDKELGYERESGKYKIGDGKTTWKELPYAQSEGMTVIKSGDGIDSVRTDNSTAEGDYTIALGDSNYALSEYSVAIGVNSVAGAKGFYISAIDFTNKKIYIANE